VVESDHKRVLTRIDFICNRLADFDLFGYRCYIQLTQVLEFLDDSSVVRRRLPDSMTVVTSVATKAPCTEAQVLQCHRVAVPPVMKTPTKFCVRFRQEH